MLSTKLIIKRLISEKYNMSRPAWKAVLSEAVVTEGKALGMTVPNNCLEGSTSQSIRAYQGTVFQTVVVLFVTRDCVPGYDRFS